MSTTALRTSPATTGSSVPGGRSTLRHSTWDATLRTALAAAAAVTFVLLAFVWPTRTSTVQHLPVDVVASGPAAVQVRAGLEKTGAFDVGTASGRAQAVARIERRESYGAVVVGTGGVEVLTASAASPVASQLLTGVAGHLGQQAGTEVAMAKGAAAQEAARLGAEAAAAQASAKTLAAVAAQSSGPQQGALRRQAQAAGAKAATAGQAAAAAGAKAQAIAAPRITTTDVVPLSKDDPRGAGLGLASLPLAMGGMIGGVLIALLVTGTGRRLAATTIYAVLGGLLLSAVLGPWLGILPGAFVAAWAVIGAALFATAATIVGLQSLVGQPGIAVGAVITMFLGNPLSGASAPVEFYPWHWGAVGQALVPGAATTLLREVTYFPHASTVHGWVVLACWALVGVTLSLLGRHRNDEVVHIDGATVPA